MVCGGAARACVALEPEDDPAALGLTESIPVGATSASCVLVSHSSGAPWRRSVTSQTACYSSTFAPLSSMSLTVTVAGTSLRTSARNFSCAGGSPGPITVTTISSPV